MDQLDKVEKSTNIVCAETLTASRLTLLSLITVDLNICRVTLFCTNTKKTWDVYRGKGRNKSLDAPKRGFEIIRTNSGRSPWAKGKSGKTSS
jgi:hypothetical protein